MNAHIRGDHTTTDGRLVRIVDRWHGTGAELNAWAEADQAAAALKRAGVVKRYGVTVQKRMVHIGGHRQWEYRLVLVDRTPEAGDAPAAVRRITARRTEVFA